MVTSGIDHTGLIHSWIQYTATYFHQLVELSRLLMILRQVMFAQQTHHQFYSMYLLMDYTIQSYFQK